MPIRGTIEYIHVPPPTDDTDSSSYSYFVESISFSNNSKLYVVMPPEGRLTKVFVKTSIYGLGSTDNNDIVVVSGAAGTWDGTKWTGIGEPLENKDYAGNLLFFVNEDLSLGAGQKTMQGTYISTGVIKFAQHTKFAGQLLAKVIRIDADFEAGDFKYVPFNDFDALREACGPKTAAVMLELVQGESGVHPANIEYAKLVDKFCKDHGILLIIDEVQTGIGRTGMMFCYERYGITPDIITLAKGLAGGVPIGAMLCTDEVATGFHVGDHGSTFGGNPLACAAANAVLDTIKEENLLVNVNEMNAYLMEKLTKLKGKYDCITDIRGLGLLIGIEFDERISASQMMIEMFRNGILVSSIGTSTIRIAPPLIIKKKEIDTFCKVLDSILKNTIPAKKDLLSVIKDKLPSTSKQVSVASFDKLPGEEAAQAPAAPAEPSAPVAHEDDDM